MSDSTTDPESGGKGERSTDAARQRVKAAAFASFAERGFDGTSMLEIASRAQMSKRDLYALYANKHAVLVDCVRERTSRMRQLLDPLAPPPQDGKVLSEMLVALGSAVLRGVCQPEALMIFRLTIAESGEAPELAETLDKAGREANHRVVTELLAKGQASGLVGPGDPPQLAARFFALLWGDLLIRLLLRVREVPDNAEIEARTRAAVAALPIV